MALFLAGLVWLSTGFVFPVAFFRKSFLDKRLRLLQLGSFGNGAFSA